MVLEVSVLFVSSWRRKQPPHAQRPAFWKSPWLDWCEETWFRDFRVWSIHTSVICLSSFFMWIAWPDLCVNYLQFTPCQSHHQGPHTLCTNCFFQSLAWTSLAPSHPCNSCGSHLQSKYVVDANTWRSFEHQLRPPCCPQYQLRQLCWRNQRQSLGFFPMTPWAKQGEVVENSVWSIPTKLYPISWQHLIYNPGQA